MEIIQLKRLFTVTGAADEASNNQWEYYVNMIHNTDNFIANLIDAVNRRGEDTIIVMFGDHLPTMGLEDSDMKSGDIFKTKYATWNNFGLPKQDADLTAYQLLAHITGQMGIHEGTMFTYTQTQADSSTYQNGLDNLQYDLLYGERYAYNGEDLYPATDLVMDVEDVNVTSVRKNALNNTTGSVILLMNAFKPSSPFSSNTFFALQKYPSPSMISTGNAISSILITISHPLSKKRGRPKQPAPSSLIVLMNKIFVKFICFFVCKAFMYYLMNSLCHFNRMLALEDISSHINTSCTFADYIIS